MATCFIHLAERVKKNGKASVSIGICHNRVTTFVKTEVSVEPKCFKLTKHGECNISNAHDCTMVNDMLYKVRQAIRAIEEDRLVRLATISSKELREMVLERIDPATAIKMKKAREAKELEERSVAHRFEMYMDECETIGTRRVYKCALGRLRRFDAEFDTRMFSDIDVEYLKRFDAELSKTSKKINGRSVTFRCIRAVYNLAIEDGIADSRDYPFGKGKRKFKIHQEMGESKALSLELFKKLISYPRNEYQDRYMDLFLIIFGLIGINMPDLAKLKKIDEDGYIRYIRKKELQHEVTYCIKVEPEIRALIDKHRGKDHLLDFFDTNHLPSQVSKQMTKALRSIGEQTDGVRTHAHGPVKKVIASIVPKITEYYARHTWASIAFNDCDLSMDNVSASLGHSNTSGSKTTQTYARAKQKMVNQANRKVLDMVFSKNNSATFTNQN